MARPKARQLKFLIDECLHPRLAEIARYKGHHAQHVNDVGRNGVKDAELFDYAMQNDLIIVTNNAADFRRLCMQTDLHAGVVIIVPNVQPSHQAKLFAAALAGIPESSDLVNKVVEVASESDIDVYDIPPGN